MESDGVSEVFGAILAFGITSVVVLGAIFIFNDANDTARQQSAVTEGVAIAESIDRAILDLLVLQGDDAVTSYEYEMSLPVTVQGEQYNFSLAGTNLFMQFQTFEVRYPLNSLGGGCDLSIGATSASVNIRYEQGAPCTISIS